MLNRRMIGRIVYDKYNFRSLPASSRDLYTYLLLNCDNEGVCDSLYTVMTLNRASSTDMRNLMDALYVYPLLNENSENMIVWLPDFLALNQIKSPKKYIPSMYREQLRERYPWAPILVVWTADGKIRTDIINDNDNLPPDPRTNVPYVTPQCQIPPLKKRKGIGEIEQKQSYSISEIEQNLLAN